MTGTSRLGLGVIGFGFMGRTHARACLAASAQGMPVELRAVTGPPGTDPPAGAVLCPSAVELLARDDVDAVSICTYTDTHVELALAALRLGKHVLVEKPVALRHEDVARLAAAEREAGLICMPAMCMRFWPGWPWLRERIASGAFGAVRRAAFLRQSARPSWGADFYSDSRRSGGALYDLHIHDVDFVRWCFGHPDAVESSGSRNDVRTTYRFPDRTIEVTAGGAWLSDSGAPFTMRYAVECEEATLDFELGRAPELRITRAGAGEPVALPAEDAYHAEVRHFLELVLGRAGRRLATLDEAEAVTRILEAEERSLAAAGAVAPVSPGG